MREIVVVVPLARTAIVARLKRVSAFALIAMVCAIAGSRMVAQSTATNAGAFRPDRILVKPVAGADLAPLHATLGTHVLRVFPAIGNLEIVALPAGATVDRTIAAFQSSGLVLYAEHDAIGHIATEPNDFRYLNGDLWNLHNTGQYGGVVGADVHAPQGWDYQRTASGIIVAIIDTGIRLTHEDLAPNLWTNPGESGPGPLVLDKSINGLDDDNDGYIDDVHGINAILGLGIPWDDYGHGTHVAGIIGAAGDNAVGVVGIAWQIQLMACKAFDSSGQGAISDIITCIDYACAKGAKIINASWGDYTFNSSSLYDAINRARQAGIIFVAAAGNSHGDNDAQPLYPASFALDNIIAVAATDRTDSLASFSNFGANSVHLGAPGDPVFSCWNGSDTDYRYNQGTSMATPHVVGACALVWALNPSMTAQQVIQRVLSTVDALPSLAGKTITGGRLDLAKALGP